MLYLLQKFISYIQVAYSFYSNNNRDCVYNYLNVYHSHYSKLASVYNYYSIHAINRASDIHVMSYAQWQSQIYWSVIGNIANLIGNALEHYLLHYPTQQNDQL